MYEITDFSVVGDHHFKDEFLFFRFKHDDKNKKFRERIRSRTASKRSTRSEDDTGSGGSSIGNRGSGSSWGSVGESPQSTTPDLDEYVFVTMYCMFFTW